MQEKLAQLRENALEWLERMDISTSTSKPTEEEEEEEEAEEGASTAIDPEDDFKREMHL